MVTTHADFPRLAISAYRKRLQKNQAFYVNIYKILIQPAFYRHGLQVDIGFLTGSKFGSP